MDIDWENEVHVLYASFSSQPLPKLEVEGSLSYTFAQAEMDDLTFSPEDDPFALPGYSFANLNGTDEFSDLNYKMFELEMNFLYRFRPDLSFGLQVWYGSFEDDDAYVYGDLDGDAYTFTGFVTYRF